ARPRVARRAHGCPLVGPRWIRPTRRQPRPARTRGVSRLLLHHVRRAATSRDPSPRRPRPAPVDRPGVTAGARRRGASSGRPDGGPYHRATSTIVLRGRIRYVMSGRKNASSSGTMSSPTGREVSTTRYQRRPLVSGSSAVKGSQKVLVPT